MNMLDTPPARGSVMGDNRPPIQDLLKETYGGLSDSADELAERANGLPKQIATDIDLSEVGSIVVAARSLVGKMDDARKAEKEPYLSGGRTVDAYFNGLIDRVSRISKVLQSRADDYQRAKAAEARRLAEEAARKAREEAERQRVLAAAAEERNRQATAAKHEDKAEAAEIVAARAEAQAEAPIAELTRVRSDDGTLATSRAPWTFAITKLGDVNLETLRPYLAATDIEKAIRAFVRVGGRELEGVKIYQDVKASFR